MLVLVSRAQGDARRLLLNRDSVPAEEEIPSSCLPKVSHPNEGAFSLVSLNSPHVVHFSVAKYSYVLTFGVEGIDFSK